MKSQLNNRICKTIITQKADRTVIENRKTKPYKKQLKIEEKSKNSNFR